VPAASCAHAAAHSQRLQLSSSASLLPLSSSPTHTPRRCSTCAPVYVHATLRLHMYPLDSIFPKCNSACRISLLCTRDSKLSAAAVLLLCLSPASVFLTYTYTEPLFLLCTFAGIWVLAEGWSLLLATLPFAGSCAVRSNGMHPHTLVPGLGAIH
jgi:hypothetical protein